MCGDTLFEVTAQTSAIFFIIFDDGSGNAVHQCRLAHLRDSLKTGRGRHCVGHVHGFSGGHNCRQGIH